MNRIAEFLAPATVALAVLCSAAADGVAPEDTDVAAIQPDSAAASFYDALLPYGQWVEIPDYGWCWYPHHIAVDWRPYCDDGRWVDTDDGWTFVSNLPWGWACFHYGRWFFNDTYGWCWYPGRAWAPAWVCWRETPGYIGWAPLPPRLRWHRGVGFDLNGVDLDALCPPSAYAFCPARDILTADLRAVAVVTARNVTLVRGAQPFICLASRDGRLTNHLPADLRARLTAAQGHPIARLQTVETASPESGAGRPGPMRIFRPDFRSPASREAVRNLSAAAAVRPVPPELEKRNQVEMQGLAAEQAERFRQLQQAQADETRRAAAAAEQQRLQVEHLAQRAAMDAELQRERTLLLNAQQREVRLRTAPNVPPPSIFTFPRRRSGRHRRQRRHRRDPPSHHRRRSPPGQRNRPASSTAIGTRATTTGIKRGPSSRAPIGIRLAQRVRR